MNYTGKECDVYPYTDEYKAIKIVLIVQAAIEYYNSETVDTTIMILNKAIWTGKKMEHTPLNPNHILSSGINAQYKSFSNEMIFILKNTINWH